MSIKTAVLLFSALAAGQAQTVTLDTRTYPIPGSTDESFTPIRLVDQGGRPMNAPDITVLPDGRIVAVGEVHEGDETLFAARRWHADGKPDETFRPPRLRLFQGCNGYPNKVVGLPDGRILISSCLATADGSPLPSGLARLEVDGTLDPTFRAKWSETDPRAIAVQPDGKILVAGYDTPLRRLKPDGSIDPDFKAWDLSSAERVALALQPDGRILVRTFGSNPVASLAPLVRLLADGTQDPGFVVSPDVLAAIGAAGNNDPTFPIGLARDGRILVAAYFRHPPPLDRDTGIVRLNADGSLDSGFTCSSFGKPLHEQADGRWLIISYGLGSIVRRIDPDGSEAKENFIYWQSGLFLTMQSDDKLLAGIDPLTRIHASSVPFSFRDLTVTGLRAVRLTLNSPRYGGNNNPDANYILEASTDLRAWLPVATNTATGLTLEFEDADAPNHPCRFYRARLVGPP